MNCARKDDHGRGGDNVVRLLPPLIVSEDEIAESVRRIERACVRLAAAQARAPAQGAAV
jgi:acetylornithine/N-succinyldiaminopimelate aminotransferase